MKSAPKPRHETRRLNSLKSLNILDTLPEAEFDQITYLASQICNTPVAVISLVDENRQWFKSKIGLSASETSRDVAFCAHAILGTDVFIVPDATKDERFIDNPLVTGDTQVTFYAGAPLKSPDGLEIGAVCVIDHKPRQLTEPQVKALKMLSEQVTRLLRLRQEIETLKSTQEKLKFRNTAIETLFEGVVIQDHTGAIVEFNPAALHLLRLTKEQLQGKNCLDPDWKAIKDDGSDFPGFEHPAMVCLKTGRPQRNVVMGIRNQGPKTKWIKINSAPVFPDEESKPSHAVTSFADISAEVVAKKQVEEKSVSLRNILDTVPQMIGLWSKDLINMNSNIGYSNFFDKTPEDIFGVHIKEIFGEDLFEKNYPFIQKALNGERVSFERSHQMKDGRILDLLIQYVPNFETGTVVSFLSVVTDMTERKKLEESKRSLEAKIADTAKLAALGEMAAGVAHEINNPLAIILGKAGQISRKLEQGQLTNEITAKHLKTIEDTAERIARIIKALKTYSRDAEKDPFEFSKVSDIVNDTLELCYERFKKRGVEIKLSMESDLEINSRPTQISQVLMNLLTNAFDATINLNEKWIEIKCSKNNDLVEIFVTDSGIGIKKEIVDKIMNPFFTTKELGKGTGLGLSISSGIIKSHGGQLDYIDSMINTTFKITLPAYKTPQNSVAS